MIFMSEQPPYSISQTSHGQTYSKEVVNSEKKEETGGGKRCSSHLELGGRSPKFDNGLMAAHDEIAPMPVAAIFADTQAEPKAVYEWLDWLEKQLPFPIHRVTAGKLEEHLTHKYWSEKNQKWTVAGLPAFTRNPDGTQGHMSRNARPITRSPDRQSNYC